MEASCDGAAQPPPNGPETPAARPMDAQLVPMIPSLAPMRGSGDDGVTNPGVG